MGMPPYASLCRFGDIVQINGLVVFINLSVPHHSANLVRMNMSEFPETV
jgi:hypothetical protein